MKKGGSVFCGTAVDEGERPYFFNKQETMWHRLGIKFNFWEVWMKHKNRQPVLLCIKINSFRRSV